MRTIWLFDIDTTLACSAHRDSLLVKTCSMCLHSPVSSMACPVCSGTSVSIPQSSWDAFMDPAVLAQDVPIAAAQTVMTHLRLLGNEIHFITGRREASTGQVTKSWLREHYGYEEASELLMMRQDVDYNVAASVYKERALIRLKEKLGLENDTMFIFFEDDSHVFPVYSKYGLVVRCPEGWQHFMPKGARGEESLWRK